jgi:hypothetical protein
MAREEGVKRSLLPPRRGLDDAGYGIEYSHLLWLSHLDRP